MSLKTSMVLSFFTLFLALAVAGGLARLLTGWSGRLAVRFGIVSHVTARSSHSVPTPRLGGIGLIAGFLGGAGIFLGGLWLLPHDGSLIGFNPTLLAWLGVGFVLMAGVGFLDDLIDLGPLIKLLLMSMASLPAVLGAGLAFDIIMPALPLLAGRVCGMALAFAWILIFVNAFNFMDGMDGFAAGFARLAGLFIFAVAFIPGLLGNSLLEVRAEAYLLPILAMACAGFLHYNRPPARIFMGDGGSLALGYLLAVAVLLGRGKYFGLPVALTASLTILMPFLFDVILTLIRRAVRGCNLFQAHREHLYQRLLATGMSHGEVLKINKIRFLLCGGLGLAGGVMQSWFWQWGCFGLALVVMMDYWMRVLRVEAEQADRPL